MITIDPSLGKHDAGIYALISTLNGGRIYVGQSIHIRKRIRQHQYKLEKGTHYNIELQKLYNEDNNLTMKVLEKVRYSYHLSIREDIGKLLDVKEAFYIIKYQNVCINRDSPYNLAKKIQTHYDNSLGPYFTPKNRKLIDVYL